MFCFYFQDMFWINVLTVFFTACLLLSFGSQPDDLILLMSRSMFFTSPLQPACLLSYEKAWRLFVTRMRVLDVK